MVMVEEKQAIVFVRDEISELILLIELIRVLSSTFQMETGGTGM